MSGDAEGKLEDIIRIARVRGLAEIGVADHFHPGGPEYSMRYEELQEYVRRVRSLRETNDFPVKLGIEVDFIPSLQSEIERIVRTEPFDYVIGSVHFIDSWGFDNAKYISQYEKWDMALLYETYFGLVQQCARSRLFNIVGHVDIIKKFGYRPKVDVTDVFVSTVDVLKECEVCVEVNTRGLMMPCREIYPSKEFLELCFDKGIPITLGSDAHKPEDVGRDFDQALKLIRDVGYENIVRFADQEWELVEI
jgi:histidinol-phosphatase (PHP family)